MDFIDRVRDLAEKALDLGPQLETEEGTKNALIMPFIALLGYDVFNPREVVPEFTADVGTKKGEKVDYAILQDGHPILLFECKSSTRSLDDNHASQLYRYYSVTEARFGILTNGLVYRFYADLEAPNKMDEKPFLEIDLLNLKESLVNELKKFHRENFNVDEILSTANELKYTREIKRRLADEYQSPSEHFVRFIAGQIYPKRVTQQALEQLTDMTRRAFHQLVNDLLNDRLKSAIGDEVSIAVHPTIAAESSPQEEDVEDQEATKDIVTTEEELHAFYLIKSTLHGQVDLGRITMRDRIRYCGILLDDNNRKPICRLHFNTAQKYIGIFDINREEERIAIESIDDIYQYTERIRHATAQYDGE